MTHPLLHVEQVLALASLGLTPTAIARDLLIPYATVRDWVYGKQPLRRKGMSGVCENCGSESHVLDQLPDSYSYLLGLYLGDGCISTHPRAVYRLRLTLDAAYPGIIEEAASAMRRVRPESKVGKLLRPDHSVQVSSYSKAWPCLFPQHGPGKKHLRRVELSPWQGELVRKAPELLLRGLIHSDGCRFMNTGRKWRYPRYSFVNLSDDIRGIFTDACDLLELHWTTSGYTVYVSRKADVDRMDVFIGPKA